VAQACAVVPHPLASQVAVGGQQKLVPGQRTSVGLGVSGVKIGISYVRHPTWDVVHPFEMQVAVGAQQKLLPGQIEYPELQMRQKIKAPVYSIQVGAWDVEQPSETQVAVGGQQKLLPGQSCCPGLESSIMTKRDITLCR